MLVSGLKYLLLPKVISDNSRDDSCVYTLLCECAQDMLDKYRQKQVEPGHSDKLGVKTRAVEILLKELSKVPKDSGATRKMIASALECHVKALQGHEHLLSERGNTYALLEQTKGLRERHGYARALLLRYHDLKKRFLGPGSPLSDEEKKVISKLAEKKGLTLKILKALEASPFRIASALVRLDKAGMLQQDLCAVLVGHRDFHISAMSVSCLEEYGMLKPALRDLCVAVIKHEDKSACYFIHELEKRNMLRPDLWGLVLKQESPHEAVNLIISLHGMISRNLPRGELWALVLKQNSAYQTENALESLRRLRISELNLLRSALAHERPDSVACAFYNLSANELYTPDNFSLVLKQKDPEYAAFIIMRLDKYQLLKGKILDQLFEHQPLGLKLVYDVICCLGETLCTEKNLYAVIHHPDIATLKSGIKNLAKSKSLDQASFEECLMKPVPMETDEVNSTV